MTSDSDSYDDSIENRLQSVRKDIVKSLMSTNRPLDSVKLLAVSKTQAAESIREAFLLGQTAFGENYLQEAREKQRLLTDLPIEWHFIGPIQSNKTREIAENFTWVHSIDRLKIAERLNTQRPDHLPALNICLQINSDAEASKGGIMLNELSDFLESLTHLSSLNVRGLMSIPSPHKTYAAQLHSFQELRVAFTQYSQRYSKQYPEMDTLSMGMSNDMQAAIQAGSTIVRIGTAIFGKRHVQ